MNGYVTAMRRYAVFSERSSRPEFWFFMLIYFVGYLICYGIDFAIFGPKIQVISALYALVHLVPSLAVSIRRLHDGDRSGWWYLIAFTGIGLFVLFAWYCMRGTPGPNRFGYPANEQLIPSQA